MNSWSLVHWVRGWSLLAGLAASAAAQVPERLDPAREFFAKGEVVRIDILLTADDRESLRQRPREYVPASLHVDRHLAWTGLGVKLKGSAGSFRNVDERPGFTVHLGKFGGEQRLHGLRRFHLNNGAQDGSRLHEWLGSEVFTAAGYPAPRVGHALVSLDGEFLGLYVLREAFDGPFLDRTFRSRAGNLYDGGFCQDLDADLEKDAGDGVDDLGDLIRLRTLGQEFDPERRTAFEQAFDVPALVDFCALEALLGHWDGYSQNRNNYRLWVPKAGAARFLPHGMDQLFGERDAPILDHPSALAASACLQVPEWRKLYRERLRTFLPLLAPKKWDDAIKARAGQLERELAKESKDDAAALREAIRDLQSRLQARYQFLREEVFAPEPKPLVLAVGKPLALKKWLPGAHTDHVEVGKKAFGGAAAWHAAARRNGDERVHGVFASRVLLARGRYRLVGKVRTDAVLAGPEDAPGAFLEVDGARSEVLVGDAAWRDLACTFEVGEFQRNVELRLEFRAVGGKAWFRADTLQLERLE
jgi:hypothetical protein